MATMATSYPSPTPIIDREPERALVPRLIAEQGARLLTLTGPGGVGKTRLALALMTSLAETFADGAVFVPLAAIADPALVPGAIAQALGVVPKGDEPIETLLQRVLRSRHQLLVLDNVEQVVDAATTIASLLGACPSLTVLATSRTPLRIQGEHAMPISPLRLPGEDRRIETLSGVPSVTLFVERARAARPGYALDAASAGTVAEIVERLDGLPLAIELAAARVRILPPGALLERLQPRLPLLTGGGDSLPDRHRTMRAAVAWSYDLLETDARRLFRRLAVFAGGCSLESAEAIGVVGTPRGIADPEARVAVLDALTELVDQALVARAAGTEDRYEMLETVREYGLEQLAGHGEAEYIRAAHAGHFLALALRAEALLEGPEQARWIRHLAAEQDNLRLALGFFVERSRGEEALRLGSALWSFWSRRGHLREGRAWLERALAVAGGASPTTRAKAARRLGNLALDLADLERAEAMYAASLEAEREFGDENEIARSLTALGLVALHRGDMERTVAFFEEARQRWDAVGDRADQARIRHNLGRAALVRGDLEAAHALLEEAAALRRELGDRGGLAYTTLYLAELALAEVRPEVAEELLLAARGMLEEQEDALGIAWVAHDLGKVALARGDLLKALGHCRVALEARLELLDRQGLAETLELLGGIAVRAGHPAPGVRWLAACAGWRETSGIVPSAAEQRLAVEVDAEAAGKLGAGGRDAAAAAGRLLTVEQAASEALASSLVVAPVPEPGLEASPAAGLTRREIEVLRQIANGLSDREIADLLYLSRRTVGTHVTNILHKLDVSTRSAAVARAMRDGLL